MPRARRRIGPVGLRNGLAALGTLMALSAASHASDTGADTNAGAWDRARAELVAGQNGPMQLTIARWKELTSSNRFGFDNYAGFVLTWPGFPAENLLRRYAEGALERESVAPRAMVAFFDRFPPLTNPARARYALALHALGRPDADGVARAAWRGGTMAEAVEAQLRAQWGSSFTPDDADARSDALLWAGLGAGSPSQATGGQATGGQATRALLDTSPARRAIDGARLAALKGLDPYAAGTPVAALHSDPGFLYARARQLRKAGQAAAAQALLANHPALAQKPLDRGKWVDELLTQARGAAASGDARSAVAIAQSLDQAFDSGEAISQMSFDLRDDYTSLVWLGGTQALWTLHDPASAAALFWRYGNAARTPGSRAKGFYWAGLALQRGGAPDQAMPYFQQAALYTDQFYGLLALERLGQPAPDSAGEHHPEPDAAERARFAAQPLTEAVREVARENDWHTAVRFFKEIAAQAQTETQHMLVADLARSIGRRDLSVIAGQAAGEKGLLNFQRIAFPLIPVPTGADQAWTMIHAITRQESQFAQNAVSHAGARGLMQLMPQTASQQAGRLGLSFSSAALLNDPDFNLQVGSAFFARLVASFNGSVPLAIAAYNAGPTNVNRWLRDNGDPRTGTIDWAEWIERIPWTETRNYVQHVLENAVVYEAINPDKARYHGPAPLGHLLTVPQMP